MSLFSKKYFYIILSVVVLLLGIASIIIVQFWSPTLYGADGYLHIRMAQFLKDFGLKYDFHWARYSTFAGNFADKDILYHILLIPFVKFLPNIFLSAKLSAIFFALLFFIIFFIILSRYSLRPLVPLFLLALLISDRFFYLFCWPRPMIFVITLTILGIHFLIEEKLWWVFIITVIYCLSHVSGPYMLFYALLAEGVRFLSIKRFNFRALAFVTLGIAVGYVIHPNFPNNFLAFYLNAIMVPIYSLKWGIELGAEFFPLSTREYFFSYPFLVFAIVLIFFIALFLRPKATLRTRVLLLNASIFFIFSFFSQRYIAHGYPFMLLSLSSYIKDYSWEMQEEFLRLKPLFYSLIFILYILGIYFANSTYKNLRQFAFINKAIDSHYEAAGEFLKKNVPKGELIFHANWSDSQYFIGLNPDNDYIVTFDPTYMYYWNPQLYNLYRDVSFGRTDDPYNILKNTFHANYGYAGKNFFSGLIEQVRKDARFKILGEDGLGIVFKLE